MRAPAALVPLVGAAVATVVLAGCSGTPQDEPSATPRTAAPALGGPVPARHRPPGSDMNGLEEQVADRLATQVAAQGLTLSFLDCPHWDRTVPSRLACRAYVDGVVASVLVRLHAAVEGKAVEFDARLGDGLVATRNLEETLRRQGWPVADCGDVPAYPADRGARIVCRVERADDRRYLVATIADRSGNVTIVGYRGGSGRR